MAPDEHARALHSFAVLSGRAGSPQQARLPGLCRTFARSLAQEMLGPRPLSTHKRLQKLVCLRFNFFWGGARQRDGRRLRRLPGRWRPGKKRSRDTPAPRFCAVREKEEGSSNTPPKVGGFKGATEPNTHCARSFIHRPRPQIERPHTKYIFCRSFRRPSRPSN